MRMLSTHLSTSLRTRPATAAAVGSLAAAIVAGMLNVPRLDGHDVKTVQRLYDAKDFDFALKPGAAAVDRGTALPNVTDGFTGRAPDLGALEVGQAPPHYGPRP